MSKPFQVRFEFSVFVNVVADNEESAKKLAESANIGFTGTNISYFRHGFVEPEAAELVRHHYEDGVCPDCHFEIPETAIAGDYCENCQHTFW